MTKRAWNTAPRGYFMDSPRNPTLLTPWNKLLGQPPLPAEQNFGARRGKNTKNGLKMAKNAENPIFHPQRRLSEQKALRSKMLVLSVYN